MPNKGAGTDGKVARTGGERGTMRMGWMTTRVMATGGAAEGWHGNKDNNKMARKMTNEISGRRGCA